MWSRSGGKDGGVGPLGRRPRAGKATAKGEARTGAGIGPPGGRSSRESAPHDNLGHATAARMRESQRRAKAEGVTPVSPQVQQRIDAQSGGGRLLDGTARAGLEPALAAPLSGVRVHDGDPAASLSRELGARAFTQGRDVFLGADAQADTIAHELTHAAENRTGPGAVQRDTAPPPPFALETPPSIFDQPPAPFGPLADPPAPALATPATSAPLPIIEAREDPENARTIGEELSPSLPADPLADALPLRAALGDRLWQQLNAAALRREALRRNQQVSYPEGNPMVTVTVDDILAPATYDDPGDANQVWMGLKGDPEPGASDQMLLQKWAVARTLSGFRASVADMPAVVALADPEAQDGGPSRLILWVGGSELALDQGLIELENLSAVAPRTLTALGELAGQDALTMLKSKTLIVQGAVQLAALAEVATSCQQAPGAAVVAQLREARKQADAIASAASMLSQAATGDLVGVKAELEATRVAGSNAGVRIDDVISGVLAFQDEKMDYSGSSLDEFWRRADDVPVVGGLFSLLSAGDSRYRAQYLQAIHDGTISYNEFDSNMNGWKEYLSAGINIAVTVATAKLAGPGAEAIFGIDATWSPYVGAATRNVFASFSTSIGKNVALEIASATTTSEDTRKFLQSQMATPTDALFGAVPGMLTDMAVIRLTRPRIPDATISQVAPEPEAGTGAGGAPPPPAPPPMPQRRALDYPEDMQLTLAGNPADATRSGMGRTNGQINWRRYEQQRATQNAYRQGLTDQTTTALGQGERFGQGRTQYSVRVDLSNQGATWFEDAKMRDFSNNANVIDAAASIQKEIRAAELQLGDGVMNAEFGISTTRNLPPKVQREILKRVALWLRDEGYSTAQMNSFLERITFTWALPK